MGRSASAIKDYIIARVATKSDLSVLASNVDPDAIFKQLIECIANVAATHDLVGDAHIAAVEEIIDNGNPHTATWIIQKALEFQYDATDPQILVEKDGIVQFDTIDEAKRLITYCGVRDSGNRQASLFVAKGSPLVKLTALELSAFSSYMNSILKPSFNLAGIQYNCTSADPDYCFIEAEVKYDGLYSATIQDAVTEAIEAYLLNLGTLGRVSHYQLSEAVQKVTGVKDFIIKNMAIRSNTTVFASATYLVDTFEDKALVSVETTAGYAYTEIESGQTLEDKLTFTAV